MQYSDRPFLKKFRGRPNETSYYIFCNSFNQIDVPKSPQNIESWTMKAGFIYLYIISRNIVIAHSLKSLKDVPMRRPATHFVRVLNKLMSKNILKALNYIQYKLLIVTQEQYHTTKVIGHSVKSLQDVPMRRPATYL